MHQQNCDRTDKHKDKNYKFETGQPVIYPGAGAAHARFPAIDQSFRTPFQEMEFEPPGRVKLTRIFRLPSEY